MALTLNDFFEGKVTLQYLAKRPKKTFMLESILPYKSIDALEYDHVVGKYNAPTTATFAVYGADGRYYGRDGIKKFLEELRPIKAHRTLAGKLLIQYKKYGAADPLFAQLFDDIGFVYDAVRVRAERMRAEVLTSGQLNVNENGVVFTVDYGIPSEHKVVPTVLWNDTTNSNPIQDMIDWKNSIDFEPEGGIISKEIFDYLSKNVNVRKAIYGDQGASRFVTLEVLNDLLKGLGLPPLAIDKEYYRDETGAKKYFWPSNKFVWVGSNIGQTLMGPTEEGVLGKSVKRTKEGIYIQVHEEERPPAIITTGSATSLVALPGAEEIFIATVF